MPSELSTTALKRQLNEQPDSLMIVDIRQPEEYALGHIPTAINIPLAELPDTVDQYDWAGDVVVVCPVGTAAAQAAQLIACYEAIDPECVYYLGDGYAGWTHGLRTESDIW